MKKMIITIEKVNDKHYVIRDSAGIKLMDATPEDDNTFYLYFDARYRQIEASDPEGLNEVETKALNLQRVSNSICPYCGSTKVIAWGEDADKCEDCELTWDV